MSCIPARKIDVMVDEATLAARRAAMEAKGGDGWMPLGRERVVSAALQAYAALTTSAANGAVRDVKQVQRRR